jgi:Cellulase (glycosyl hydrolase family 5)
VPRRAALVAVLAAGVAGCGGSSPPAPPRFETVVQDDALLLHRPAELPRTVRTLKALGVDRVRISATWSQIAPKEDGPRNWRNLDRAVNAVTRAGLRVMIDVGFFAPRWAGGSRRPDPEKLAGFAGTLAERYPQVRLWTIWNEPNHPVFMQPQWRGGVPVSAHVYRRMHELGYEAIKEQSEENRVLLGGLSSLGGDGRGGVRPLRFLRELACVDERLQPLRRTECEGFEPLRADGFAMHPYVHKRPPTERRSNPDEVGIADLARLSRLLAALDARGRIRGRLPVYVTEFGYETDPPDPRRGVAPPTQAAYLQGAVGEVLARPDVRMHAQFLLRDLADDGLYQTGLQQPDGKPKPSLFTFPVSFAVRRGTGLGLVRPGRGRREVAVERLLRDGSWSAVEQTATDVDGVVRQPGLTPGTYRLRWGRASSLPASFAAPGPG